MVCSVCCRKVEQGQEKGLSLDSTALAQSSQCLFIKSKPDYHGILCRQKPMLHTVEMIVSFKNRFLCHHFLFLQVCKEIHNKMVLKLQTLWFLLLKCKMLRYQTCWIKNFFFFFRWTLSVRWLENFNPSRSNLSCLWKRPVADWVIIIFYCCT